MKLYMKFRILFSYVQYPKVGQFLDSLWDNLAKFCVNYDPIIAN